MSTPTVFQRLFPALLAVLVAAAAAVATAAQPERLGDVERELETKRRESEDLKRRAETIVDEMRRLRRELVATGAKAQNLEAEKAALEARLKELSADEAAAEVRLKASRGEMARVLAALERLARYPPEAVLVAPLDPADTVRSAILLRAAVPRIEGHAARLRGDLESLAGARAETERRRRELAAATANLATQRHRIDTLLADKARLRQRVAGEREAAEKRMEALAREAGDLRELMQAIETERARRLAVRPPAGAATGRPAPAEAPAEETQALVAGLPPITRAQGRLQFPAVGRVIGLYGESTGTGLTRKGIDIETADSAQVVAPYDGVVVYAGAFRGYGQLLIIEHGEGYHSLLAGMARIDAASGQLVAAGEPVGVMDSSKNERPTLYVELRRKGQPINPMPWLAARNDKVSG